MIRCHNQCNTTRKETVKITKYDAALLKNPSCITNKGQMSRRGNESFASCGILTMCWQHFLPDRKNRSDVISGNAVGNLNQWGRRGGRKAAVRYAAVRQKRILAGAGFFQSNRSNAGPCSNTRKVWPLYISPSWLSIPLMSSSRSTAVRLIVKWKLNAGFLTFRGKKKIKMMR